MNNSLSGGDASSSASHRHVPIRGGPRTARVPILLILAMESYSHLRFDAWVHSVDTYSGDDLLQEKGEQRKNPFRERKRFDATDFLATSKTKADEQEEDKEEQGANMDKAELADMEG
ncbi:hypothetical protein EI94DRAFT_1702384 [Lactarius quietus]|nr:hypothetical protein EI94DRAFT_1702384 [Lactarius quietus]